MYIKSNKEIQTNIYLTGFVQFNGIAEHKL